MPIFQLTDAPVFPHPSLAEDNGLLAVGGDLSVERLLAAYSQGIFPWYSEGEPPLWWFTDPRLVIFPEEFKVSKRLARTLRNTDFRITFDKSFDRVITSCANIRTENGEGTWISRDMQQAYCRLHRSGYAHSVECWQNETLAGGLYGVRLGKVFFGESMFTKISNGSKAALIALVTHLQQEGVALIDCQMTTSHLITFGAREISGAEFRRLLRIHIDKAAPQEN
ncbi:MAG: leucyl/phenylalanyl-tRNA--protein transferase [Proteobacteria bacterium]|nr:leucyl/phenylalanyl-tRNA--protein transferase [Pseudomonadota bacterium]MBU1138111.1 leucyl/phenylalanyl-tRNA--protein transferase [Pseudomonadota bacterium]MBU1234404.1 leucyl/phenylalanyl-tRNA--protein transferase [Pseudomonadota bacterium]MBU1417615.1 leucyl/phenylalanyl-tRNA--protein transferase [Pseudomonadota bacterium]MBU1456426.1 leucyl/phenylalanyl-tRNA--protein transferase [Pseudomonadota bacterium]